MRRLRESGSYAALPMGGRKPFVLACELDWLRARMAAKPDLTLRELLAELQGRGIEVSGFALWNIVRRAGLNSRKTIHANEQDRPMSPANASRRQRPRTLPRRRMQTFHRTCRIQVNLKRTCSRLQTHKPL